MDRDNAVTRIKRGLGFYSGTARDASIIEVLQEAQRDLEEGKTLPKFLLQEDQTISLAAGDRTAPLPTDFLRVFDDERPHFQPSNSTLYLFMMRRLFSDASLAYQRFRSGSIILTESTPQVYVIRKDTIDFMFPANDDYEILWSYYKRGTLLTTNVENEWLENAPNWLIGEAGARMAMDMRDQEALGTFQQMAQKGRAACFGEIIASEEADGPFIMGANN